LRIDLAPLSKQGTQELIQALLRRLDAVPTGLRDLLARSAEGNPYFVEELIGMLIDDGVIVTDGEPWRVSADKLLDVRVPSTLAGVLQARIDGLPPAEKSALQQASVIGHIFWEEALQRIAPTAGEVLDGLTRRELAYGRETSAFEGTREFVFKHHVLHQVAYQGVLKQTRREYHRVTADWLVVRSGDRASEYFGLIAEHYEKAGDKVSAAGYLGKAGKDAVNRYANPAALDYLGRALALTPPDDAPARFELLRARYRVYSNTGRARGSRRAARRRPQARPCGEPPLCVFAGHRRLPGRSRRGEAIGRAGGDGRQARSCTLVPNQLGARAPVPGRLLGDPRSAHRRSARAGARIG
jgi:predicted ATPase